MTEREKHLAYLKELRDAAEAADRTAEHMGRSSSEAVAKAAELEAEARWASYYEAKAGTQ